MTCDCKVLGGESCHMGDGCKAMETMAREALQQAGNHPAPCARSCEANAYEIEIRRLSAELDRERMRLAACGVVAMADTLESAAQAREMRDEYRSASCDDVARRTDECMTLRAERDALTRDAERYRWIREHRIGVKWCELYSGGPALDEAIDSTMKALPAATAKARFDRAGGHEEPDPVERLRFFCAQAMGGQDWLDVEPFFDAVIAQRDATAAKLAAAQGMADTMAMLRSEMIESGVIDASVAPMFFPESIIPRLRTLAELDGQEPVAWYADIEDWGREYNGRPELSNGVIGKPLYARPVPAEPVNARLLDALKYAAGCLGTDGNDPIDLAITSAAAQQERFLQDMHDAGREIDRVMDETEKKAVRLTHADIAKALASAGLKPEDYREDGEILPLVIAIESAALRKNGIEVAE